MSTNDTLALVRDALAKANDIGELAKAATFTQSTIPTVGLQTYDLEAPAKNLYPVLTPLRNRIPRVSGKGGSQANWKAVTGVNTGSVFAGVSEGRRGGLIAVTTKEYFAAYRTIGLESAVTYEAEAAAEGFDDLRARATTSLLQSVMIAEEKIILGSNTSYALGTTPTPTLAALTTGGAIAASTTVSVICVALTFDGLQQSSMTNGVVQQVTVNPTDGQGPITSGAGSAGKSANATVTTGAGGGTNSVVAVVTPVRGAYGYAWFAGAAGSERLVAITNVSQYVVTTLPTSTQLASALTAGDNSTVSLVYDGLLGMIGNPTNGSYYFAATAGAGLTGDATGGIVELDTALQYYWDNLRLSPDRILVSSQEMLWLRKKTMTGATTTATRFTFAVTDGKIVGGGMPKGYLNPFAMSGGPAEIPIELHPNMPPGTIMFETDNLPYPMNNVTNVLQIRARRDYYQIEWPIRMRQYEYGVYSDEVLQNYFPPGFGIITNLSPA